MDLNPTVWTGRPGVLRAKRLAPTRSARSNPGGLPPACDELLSHSRVGRCCISSLASVCCCGVRALALGSEATASRCCSHPPAADSGDAGVAEATRVFVSGLGQDPVDEPDRRSSLELCSNVGPVAEQGKTRNDHEIGRVQALAVEHLGLDPRIDAI